MPDAPPVLSGAKALDDAEYLAALQDVQKDPLHEALFPDYAKRLEERRAPRAIGGIFVRGASGMEGDVQKYDDPGAFDLDPDDYVQSVGEKMIREKQIRTPEEVDQILGWGRKMKRLKTEAQRRSAVASRSAEEIQAGFARENLEAKPWWARAGLAAANAVHSAVETGTMGLAGLGLDAATGGESGKAMESLKRVSAEVDPSMAHGTQAAAHVLGSIYSPFFRGAMAAGKAIFGEASALAKVASYGSGGAAHAIGGSTIREVFGTPTEQGRVSPGELQPGTTWWGRVGRDGINGFASMSALGAATPGLDAVRRGVFERLFRAGVPAKWASSLSGAARETLVGAGFEMMPHLTAEGIESPFVKGLMNPETRGQTAAEGFWAVGTMALFGLFSGRAQARPQFTKYAIDRLKERGVSEEDAALLAPALYEAISDAAMRRGLDADPRTDEGLKQIGNQFAEIFREQQAQRQAEAARVEASLARDPDADLFAAGRSLGEAERQKYRVETPPGPREPTPEQMPEVIHEIAKREAPIEPTDSRLSVDAEGRREQFSAEQEALAESRARDVGLRAEKEAETVGQDRQYAPVAPGEVIEGQSVRLRLSDGTTVDGTFVRETGTRLVVDTENGRERLRKADVEGLSRAVEASEQTDAFGEAEAAGRAAREAARAAVPPVDAPLERPGEKAEATTEPGLTPEETARRADLGRRADAGEALTTAENRELEALNTKRRDAGGAPAERGVMGFEGPGVRPVDSPSRPPKPEVGKTLWEFVRAEGGVAPRGGQAAEVSELRNKESGTSGIVRRDGKDAEAMLQRAVEEGYLPEETTLNEFYEILKHEGRELRSPKTHDFEAEAEADFRRRAEQEAERVFEEAERESIRAESGETPESVERRRGPREALHEEVTHRLKDPKTVKRIEDAIRHDGLEPTRERVAERITEEVKRWADEQGGIRLGSVFGGVSGKTAKDAAKPIGFLGRLLRGAGRGVAQQTQQYPKLTKENPRASVDASRLASAPVLADRLTELATRRVVKATGVDSEKFVAAGTVDQLDAEAAAYRGEARQLREQANRLGVKKDGTPYVRAAALEKDAQAADKMAERLTRIADGIAEDVFETRKGWEDYLKDPTFVAARDAHQQVFEQYKNPLYVERQEVDPDDAPTLRRGPRTGLRWNMLADLEPAPSAAGQGAAGSRGVENATKSPHARRVVGSSRGYVLDYEKTMRHSFSRELPGAAKVRLFRSLEAGGDAVIGDRPDAIKGETPVLVGSLKGKTVWVRESLAGPKSELWRALNVDSPASLGEFGERVLTFLNRQSLAGLQDNIINAFRAFKTTFSRPLSGNLPAEIGLNVAAPPVQIARAVGRVLLRMRPTLERLVREIDRTEQGAGRRYHDTTIFDKTLTDRTRIGGKDARKEEGGVEQEGGVAIPGTGYALAPFRVALRAISKFGAEADRAARDGLDTVYDDLVRRGVVEWTPEGKRDFINQLGNYVRAAQSPFVRALVDTGLGPFTQAKVTRWANVARALGLDPGVKAASKGQRVMLALEMFTKYTGVLWAMGLSNTLFTGNPLGRPGVPFGSLDFGKTDDDTGQMKFWNFLEWTGLADVFKATGAKGAITDARRGLPSGEGAKKGALSFLTEIANAPVVNFGSTVATGKTNPFGDFESVPKVGPDESQFNKNLEYALLGLNPWARVGAGVASGAGIVSDSDEIEAGDEVAKMLSYFVPKKTMTEKAAETLPARVRARKTGEFEEGQQGLKSRIYKHAGPKGTDVKAAVAWLRKEIEQGITDGVLAPAERAEVFGRVLDSYLSGLVSGKR